MSNKRCSWFCPNVSNDTLAKPMVVPDFTDELSVVNVTNPIDPRTGFPISDLSLYMSNNCPDDVKQLILNGLQRLGNPTDTSQMTDEQIMSLLPSRYTQYFGEVSQWRQALKSFMSSEVNGYLSSLDDSQSASSVSDPAPTAATAANVE